jgi:hypothetical protein
MENLDKLLDGAICALNEDAAPKAAAGTTEPRKQGATKAKAASPSSPKPQTKGKPAKSKASVTATKKDGGASDAFKQAIEAYLKGRPDMAGKMQAKGKSIDGCCAYIIGEMRKRAKGSQALAVTDEEVFGLAVHYYDESDENLKKEK